MTQQKTEAQLKEEALQTKVIANIKAIIRFLGSDDTQKKYPHQAALIKALQSMVDGKNKPAAEGSTAEERTLLSLKIAIAHLKPNGWQPFGDLPLSQQKATLINACLESLPSHIEKVPDDVIKGVIRDYLTEEAHINLGNASPRLFKEVWTTERLLSAVFMGEEEIAAEIMRVNPDLLFKPHTYKMPLLNQDGTPSDKSEQMYHKVTPLQLMLYTGDWKLWERIFPLIPEARWQETLNEMHKIARGGPDLVKIDRDPTQLSIDELKHYHVKDTNGKPICDDHRKPIIYDLLGNPNGLFYRAVGNQVQFFFVSVNPDTNEKHVTPLPAPLNMTDADAAALHQLTHDNSLPMNSSRRTSDAEHALIKRLFGVTLERNGIHYTLNGTHYQDTYDGCIRLKNAYRQYIEIYNAHQAGTPWDDVDAAWCNVVGMAQRLSMVHVIQRFCEENQPFYPLQNENDLKSRPFVRTDKFYSWVTDKMEKVYPPYINSGVGFNFGLYKPVGADGVWPLLGWKRGGIVDLAAIRLIDEVRKTCFNEQMNELDQKQHPSSDQSSGPGCAVM